MLGHRSVLPGAHGPDPVRSILDLGCGTGNHSLVLAGRGYQVTGVDFSADMLERARGKLALACGEGRKPAGKLELVQGDVRSVGLGRQFDAVLMMFAVLGYQIGNQDVQAALATVRRHLKPGGVFFMRCVVRACGAGPAPPGQGEDLAGWRYPPD